MSTETTTTAVNTAYKYLVNALVAGGTSLDKLSNFRVEEVVTDQTTKNFKITLSYDVSGDLQFDKKREYKDFDVTADGKSVLAMRIRKV
ncbi:MAG: hypothetical protein KGI69_02840 [Patescibacteria group bacterium]|nr:hypothetical protein [Patescibacteria group bacterium]